MALVTSNWKFPLKGIKRDVTFLHNTFSGRQTLWMDGEQLMHSKWKYELVGDFAFVMKDGTVGIVRISPAGVAGFDYKLFINNKEISTSVSVSNEATVWKLPSGGAGAALSSSSHAASGTTSAAAASAASATGSGQDRTQPSTVIEFDHIKLEVWIDQTALSLENGELTADFLDGDQAGSAYRFKLPSGVQACIEVHPLRRGKSQARLVLDPDDTAVEVKPVLAPAASRITPPPQKTGK